MAKGAQFKFPNPQDVKPNNPCAFRSVPVAVALYNQETGEEAEKLSATVKDWYKKQADKLGWSKVYFPTDYPTAGYAGVVFILFSSHAQVGKPT